MHLLSNFGGHRCYGSEGTNHLLYEYLRESWIHCLDQPWWKIQHIISNGIGYIKFFPRTLSALLFYITPCLSTPDESTLESSPVKLRATKSVPGEKGLDFLPPQCVLVIWATPRKILDCWIPQWIFEVLVFPRWYCSDSLWSLINRCQF